MAADPKRKAAQRRELAALQRAVSRGAQALAERDVLLAELHADGWLQRELTEACNVGSAKAGGPPLTEGAVHKAIRRQVLGRGKAAVR